MAEMSFDGKSTSAYWGLELISCVVTAPQRKKHWIDVPAGNGQIDAMRGLGNPVYEMRTLTAVFKVPKFRRRPAVAHILNELEGREVPIVTPDNPNYYWIGEPHLRNAGATASDEITIESTVYPWKYARTETVISVPASDNVVAHTWYNGGSRAAVPELEVIDKNVYISIGNFSTILAKGKYDLSEFEIPGNGSISVLISGGSLTARYREANLG